MAKKKSKKQIEDEDLDELKKRALEPFKPRKTMQEMLEEEARIREQSMKNYHKLKEEISESEMDNIKSRASFEHEWN